MSIFGFIRGRWRETQGAREKSKFLREPAPGDIPRADWNRSLTDPTGFYLDCFRFFHQRLPAKLKEHRAYFDEERRGFGEDAFHVMWFLLFRAFKPANFLEIGIFRGQTVSLAALLSRLNGFACEIQGISPFSSVGDAVSHYSTKVEYYEDTLRNFDHFKLPHPKLLRAYSTDPEARALIGSKSWEMVYIDGNHDYEIARQDWENCSTHLKPGGVVVLDDASRDTAFRPPHFATAGHPGPSKLAREIPQPPFRELLRVGHNRVFQKLA